jgi:hypothetical protein
MALSIRSKYIGEEFDGWKVIWGETVSKNHKRFYLNKIVTNKQGESTKLTMTLRCNVLTKLVRGELHISEVVVNKTIQAGYGIRPFHNTIHRTAL